MKQLKEYITLYPNCRLIEEGGNIGDLLGYATFWNKVRIFTNCSSNEPYWSDMSLYRLCLRPWSDMTAIEILELGRIEFCNGRACYNVDQFKFLLLHSFDIFGLIESGLAIDKTKN